MENRYLASSEKSMNAVTNILMYLGRDEFSELKEILFRVLLARLGVCVESSLKYLASKYSKIDFATKHQPDEALSVILEESKVKEATKQTLKDNKTLLRSWPKIRLMLWFSNYFDDPSLKTFEEQLQALEDYSLTPEMRADLFDRVITLMGVVEACFNEIEAPEQQTEVKNLKAPEQKTGAKALKKRKAGSKKRN